MSRPNQVKFSKADKASVNFNRKRKMMTAEEPEIPCRDNYPPDKFCTSKCKRSACRDIPLEHRQQIYMAFFYMNPDERNLFVACSVSKCDPETSKWNYILRYGGFHYDVCVTAFIKILDTNEHYIDRIKRRIEKNEVFPRNMIGRSPHQHKIEEVYQEAAIGHMHSYPKLDNHYCREKFGDIEFLLPTITITQMYDDFCQEHGSHLMSETYYRGLFHHPDTKLRIGSPHTDCCDTCDYLAMQLRFPENEEHKKDLLKQQKKHHDEARETINEYKADKELAKTYPEKYVTLTGDAQKNWSLPGLKNQSSYFKRKFNAYNFGIHDAGTDHGYMYIWSEVIGKKGSSDIASIYYKHFTSNYAPLVDGNERILNLWSDRCVGQNNNYTMIVLMQQLVKLGYFTTCHLKFFKSGHSYNDSDADFAPIEKRHRRNPVNTPSGMVQVILDARPSQPFFCIQLTQKDFYNFLPLQDYFKKPSKLKVTFYLSFKIQKEDLNIIMCKPLHTDQTYEEFAVLHKGVNIDIQECPSITSLLAYTRPLALKPAKKMDLVDLMKFLKPEERKFYWPHIKGPNTSSKLKKLFPNEFFTDHDSEDEEDFEQDDSDEEP